MKIKFLEKTARAAAGRQRMPLTAVITRMVSNSSSNNNNLPWRQWWPPRVHRSYDWVWTPMVSRQTCRQVYWWRTALLLVSRRRSRTLQVLVVMGSNMRAHRSTSPLVRLWRLETTAVLQLLNLSHSRLNHRWGVSYWLSRYRLVQTLGNFPKFFDKFKSKRKSATAHQATTNGHRDYNSSELHSASKKPRINTPSSCLISPPSFTVSNNMRNDDKYNSFDCLICEKASNCNHYLFSRSHNYGQLHQQQQQHEIRLVKREFDEEDLFGLFVAASLKKCPDEHRLAARMEILRLLYLIQQQNPLL